MESLSQPEGNWATKWASNRRGIAWVYGWTVVLCIAIALLLWAIGVEEDLAAVTLVSFCIGLSVCTAFILVDHRLNAFVGPYVAPIPIAAAGLSVGLVLGGLGVAGDPWLFFVHEHSTLMVGMFFSAIAFAIFSTQARLSALKAELARAEARRANQEKAALSTELKLLQAQIEPHFLFNTLSNVIGMIRPRPEDAETTLVHLTTLLRASLQRSRAQIGTLGDELNIVRAFLEIQRIRMGERLRFDIDCDAPFDVLLPPLIVQPLVENAVRHGIDPLEDGGEINVRIRVAEKLHIRVADTGHGPTAATGVSGSGLANVRARLFALYGSEADLKLSEQQPHGLVADLVLPVNAEQTTAAEPAS